MIIINDIKVMKQRYEILQNKIATLTAEYDFEE